MGNETTISAFLPTGETVQTFMAGICRLMGFHDRGTARTLTRSMSAGEPRCDLLTRFGAKFEKENNVLQFQIERLVFRLVLHPVESRGEFSVDLELEIPFADPTLEGAERADASVLRTLTLSVVLLAVRSVNTAQAKATREQIRKLQFAFNRPGVYYGVKPTTEPQPGQRLRPNRKPLLVEGV